MGASKGCDQDATSLFPPRLVPFSFRALLAVLISANSTMAKPRAVPWMDGAAFNCGTAKRLQPNVW